VVASGQGPCAACNTSHTFHRKYTRDLLQCDAPESAWHVQLPGSCKADAACWWRTVGGAAEQQPGNCHARWQHLGEGGGAASCSGGHQCGKVHRRGLKG
jgi:hypothetical protein